MSLLCVETIWRREGTTYGEAGIQQEQWQACRFWMLWATIWTTSILSKILKEDESSEPDALSQRSGRSLARRWFAYGMIISNVISNVWHGLVLFFSRRRYGTRPAAFGNDTHGTEYPWRVGRVMATEKDLLEHMYIELVKRECDAVKRCSARNHSEIPSMLWSSQFLSLPSCARDLPDTSELARARDDSWVISMTLSSTITEYP